jgi:hypothetical protein
MERRDTLPEHVKYRDTGCSLSPSCLACPLPVCRYDTPSQTEQGFRTRQAVLELRDKGMRPTQIAARLGVTRRTVWRYLKDRA